MADVTYDAEHNYGESEYVRRSEIPGDPDPAAPQEGPWELGPCKHALSR